jgi:hypothetical protein
MLAGDSVMIGRVARGALLSFVLVQSPNKRGSSSSLCSCAVWFVFPPFLRDLDLEAESRESGSLFNSIHANFLPGAHAPPADAHPGSIVVIPNVRWRAHAGTLHPHLTMR